MKKWLLVMLLVLGAGAPVLAQEAAPATSAAVEAAEEGVGTGKAIGANVLLIVIEIAGGILVIVVLAISKKYLKKLGLENNKMVNDLLTSLVKKGINAAEAWGQKNKKSGNEKLDKAIGIIGGLAESSGVKNIAKEKLVEFVEGQLTRDKEKNG